MTTVAELGKARTGEFVIIHAFGANPCRGVAFFYKGTIGPGETIHAQNATHPNGEIPEAGNPMRCGTCWRKIGIDELRIYCDHRVFEAKE